MHVALLVPAPWDTISGGYAYDRHMVAGLRAAGHTVTVVELAGRHPLADTTAQDAACAAWDALPDDARAVIDGLALPAFAGMEDALAGRGAIALIHHPVALETGLGADVCARLQATEQRLLAHCSRVVVTSETTAGRLADAFGVARRRIAVVEPGTDPAPRAIGSAGPDCAVLSVGALVPRKGHDVLLRALAPLFDLAWHLTIVGTADCDPVHARSLAALAAQLGIAQRVRFAGAVSAAALDALWLQADLFALTTHWEGYGTTIAEALRRGLPVALTAGGAAGHLVAPSCGVVCQPNDPVQLSKAIRRLIISPDLRRDMAAAAWQAGSALPSWQTQTRAFAEVLLQGAALP